MEIGIGLFGKNVKVTCKDGEVIVGEFIEDFEDEKKILIGLIELDYDDIEKMELAE